VIISEIQAMKPLCSSVLLGLLAACASAPADGPLPHYLCEQNLQFTARFIDNSVTLDSNQGFEVLFKKLGGNPHDYGNPRVSAEFNLGPGGKEALLRYPLLPLALRCVRTN
jgi:hypothetical protein